MLFLAAALISAVPVLQGQTTYRISKSTMTVAGTSNLHDWTTSVTELKGSGTFVLDGNSLKEISSLDISIPVNSMKSSKGSVMDGKTYNALKYKQFSLISFKIAQVGGIEKTTTGFRVKTTGNLTVAGIKKSISLTVDGKVLSDGSLNFKGSKTLQMTDFGVDPPTALMGAMTVGNEVTVTFDVTLAK